MSCSGGYVQRDKERLEVAKRVIDSVFARMSGTPSTMAQSGVSGSSYSHAEVKPQLAAAGGTINSPSGQQRYNSVSEIMEAALQRQRNSQGAGTSGTNGTTPSGVLRCHCGSRDASDLVSCSACGMRQHRRCNLVSGADSALSFMCETCRAQRADPFWWVHHVYCSVFVGMWAVMCALVIPIRHGLQQLMRQPQCASAWTMSHSAAGTAAVVLRCMELKQKQVQTSACYERHVYCWHRQHGQAL